jgi:hypothetical protein
MGSLHTKHIRVDPERSSSADPPESAQAGLRSRRLAAMSRRDRAAISRFARQSAEDVLAIEGMGVLLVSAMR